MSPPGGKIKIVGGRVNHIKGDLRTFDYSRHEINTDSYNTRDNIVTNSYNNNSKSFSGQIPHEMGRTASASADTHPEDSAGYPPPRPAQQMPSAGGPRYITNRDAFNVTNNNISDSLNDRSQKIHYEYQEASPSINPRPSINPQNGIENLGHNIRQTHSDIREKMQQSFVPRNSNDNDDSESDDADSSSSHSVSEKDAMSTRMAGLSIRDPPMPSPTSKFNSRPQTATQLATHPAFSMTKSHPQNPITQVDHGTDFSHPSNLNHYHNNPYLGHPHSHPPFSAHMKQPAMANFPSQITQVDRGTDSSRPSNLNHHNNPYLGHPHPHPSFSAHMKQPAMPNFPSQITQHGMDSSRPSNSNTYNNSPYLDYPYSNPSFAPHMKQSAMPNLPSQSTSVHQHDIRGNDGSYRPPVPSSGFNPPQSSNRGPTIRYIDGDMTKYDTSTHQTNISSFNTERNVIKNSFNNNSSHFDYSSKKYKN